MLSAQQVFAHALHDGRGETFVPEIQSVQLFHIIASPWALPAAYDLETRLVESGAALCVLVRLVSLATVDTLRYTSAQCGRRVFF